MKSKLLNRVPSSPQHVLYQLIGYYLMQGYSLYSAATFSSPHPAFS